MSKGSSGQLGQPVSNRTPREDPGMSKGSSGSMGTCGMSKGSSGQHRQLCERDMKGGSRDVLGILDPPKTKGQG